METKLKDYKGFTIYRFNIDKDIFYMASTQEGDVYDVKETLSDLKRVINVYVA